MKSFTLLFLGIALALAVVLSPFASSEPDGLEKVAEAKGFEERATEIWHKAPMPDYSFGPEAAWKTSVAGAVGTLLVFGVLLGTGKWLARRRA